MSGGREPWESRLLVLRYLVAGGATFLCEYAVFVGIYYVIGWHNVYFANAISFIFALIVGFGTSRWWVFRSNRRLLHNQFFFYTGLAAFNLILSTLIIAGLLSLHIAPYICKPVAMSVIITWNFTIGRRLIF